MKRTAMLLKKLKRKLYLVKVFNGEKHLGYVNIGHIFYSQRAYSKCLKRLWIAIKRDSFYLTVETKEWESVKSKDVERCSIQIFSNKLYCWLAWFFWREHQRGLNFEYGQFCDSPKYNYKIIELKETD